jgi:hypothetical protein
MCEKIAASLTHVLRTLHTLQMAMELLGAKTVDNKGGAPYTKTAAENVGEMARDDDAEEGKRRRDNLQKRSRGLGTDGQEGNGVLGEDEGLDKIFEQEGWDPVKRAFHRKPDWHRIHAQVCTRTLQQTESSVPHRSTFRFCLLFAAMARRALYLYIFHEVFAERLRTAKLFVMVHVCIYVS